MSNLLQPVDLQVLEAVTGGATKSPQRAATSNEDLLETLNSLSSTLKNLGSAARSTGFSTTEILMLGLLMNQRNQVHVFVRRPSW